MGKIDLLLGMDVVSEILRGWFVKGSRGSPMAYQEASIQRIQAMKSDAPSQQIRTMICLNFMTS